MIDSLPMKIINRPSDQAKRGVGDAGIEPATSSVNQGRHNAPTCGNATPAGRRGSVRSR
jgi:hypothetical protein